MLEEQISRDAGLSGADYAVLVPLSEAPDGMLPRGSSAVRSCGTAAVSPITSAGWKSAASWCVRSARKTHAEPWCA